VRISTRSVAFAMLLTATPVLADPGTPVSRRDLTTADRALIAAKAYWVIRTYFAHAAGLPSGYDLEREYRARLTEALAAPDRRGFSLAMMKLFASLANGHTGFTDQALIEAAPDAPYRIRRVEGRWTVLRSALTTLPPGSVIATIDGEPVDSWLLPRRAYVARSSAMEVDRAIFGSTFLFPDSFTLGLVSGTTVPINLKATHTSLLPVAPQQDRVEVTRRPGGIIVIRIPNFGEPQLEADAVAAVHQATVEKVPAILFDLRGNGGGNTPDKLLSAIMTAPYRGTIVETPQMVAENDAHASLDEQPPAFSANMLRYGPGRSLPKAEAYSGRVAVLVDGGCASACEDFVIRFADGKRGRIYGEPTFGSTGQPYFVDFPELRISFQVSTKREFLPDGRPFEGVGVQPNQPVPLTIADVTDPRDRQLDNAIELFSHSP